MEEYTYYFVDGTKSTILVDDEWYEVLKAMDEEERKKTYNYARHNYPLSLVDYEGETFIDPSGDPFEILVLKAEKERIDIALATFTDKQRELFEMVYYEKKKIIDIAAEQGVCFQAISNRLERIRKKLQKFLA